MKALLFNRATLASSCTALLAALILVPACTQQPNTTLTGPTTEPMSASSPAHPAVTYGSIVVKNGTNYGAVSVMDSDAKHQTAIATSPSSSKRYGDPNWSPTAASICFSTYDFVNPDTIKAIDVSVNANGVPVGSNLRSVFGFSNTTRSISGPTAWSSTSTKDMIAYCATDAQATTYALWVVPAAGGTPTNVFSFDTSWMHVRGALQYPTWSPDDSRLAVVRQDSANSTGVSFTIMIFNTSDWTYVDSVKVAGLVRCLEWSRMGLNKLAFMYVPKAHPANNLAYCDPTTGATVSTQNVLCGALTWSPNNSSILYAAANGSGLSKVVPFTNTTTSVTTLNVHPKWKR